MYTHVVPPDYINATSAYRKSLEFAPNFYPALGALAMLYGVPENVISLSEAISFCEKALSINPSKSLWLTLSRLYEISNKESCAYNAQLNSKFELYDNPGFSINIVTALMWFSTLYNTVPHSTLKTDILAGNRDNQFTKSRTV